MVEGKKMEEKKVIEEKDDQEYDHFVINFKLKTHKTHFIVMEDLAQFILYRLEPMINNKKHCTLFINDLSVKKQE